jgi:hypothetical protein
VSQKIGLAKTGGTAYLQQILSDRPSRPQQAHRNETGRGKEMVLMRNHLQGVDNYSLVKICCSINNYSLGKTRSQHR